jgi:hypothetical protein
MFYSRVSEGALTLLGSWILARLADRPEATGRASSVLLGLLWMWWGEKELIIKQCPKQGCQEQQQIWLCCHLGSLGRRCGYDRKDISPG